MLNRKIIVVPCIVKNSLYASGLRTPMSGPASCTRMTSATIPETKKKANAV